MEQQPTPLEPEDLLERSAWIRQLAAQLVSDPALREDVVQQSLLEALCRPTPVLNARAWLARLVRNTAWAAARSANRRRRLEKDAPPPPRARPTDDLVAEAELHQRIGRAVLDLEEPYRSTVLMRYFRGWTPKEIGEREGIPAGTVRSRLKRALDQLRHRFAGEQRSSREAWLALLLPTGLAEPVALASSSSLVLGGFVMSLKTLLVGLAAVAVATPLVLYWSGILETGAPGPAPAPLAATAPSGSSVAEDEESGSTGDAVAAVGGAPVRRGIESSGSPWRTGVIRGVVHEFAGRPLPGMTVALVPSPDAAALERLREAYPEPFQEATRPRTTDAAGRFAFPGVPVGAYWCVTAQGGDYVRGEQPFVEVRAAEVTEVEFALAPGGTVTGFVADTAGCPVPGAEVEAYPAGSVGTALDGSFVLRGVPSRLTVLRATKAGLAMAAPHPVVEVQPGEVEAGVRIVMFPDRPIRGVVKNDTGRQVEGAELVCKQGAGERPAYVAVTHSDEWGVFCLAPVPDSGLFLIEVEALGYLPHVENGVAPGSSIEIVLAKAGRIDVIPIAGETGEPAPVSGLFAEKIYPRDDGTEKVLRLGRFKPDQPSLEVAPNRFSVPYDGAGRHRVCVEAHGYAPAFTATFELNGNEAVGPLVVTLERGARIAGIVVHSDTATPVPGARITLLSPPVLGHASSLDIHGVSVRDDFGRVQYTSTGADGTFSFDGLLEGSYVLRVTGPAIPGMLVEGVVIRGGRAVPLRIVLAKGGAVTGTVIGLDGEPVAGLPVVAHQMTGIVATATTDAAGIYRITPLSPGPYRVEPGNEPGTPGTMMSSSRYSDDPASAPAPDPRDYTVVVHDGCDTRVDLDLRSGRAAITGRVLVNGQPWPGLVLRLSFIIDPGPGERADTLRRIPRSVTTEDGSFRLDGLRPGTYDVTVSGPGSSLRLAERRVRVAGGVDPVVDIELQTARLRGVVLDGGNGDLIERVAVRVSRRGDDDRRNRLEELTDGVGAFDLGPLPPGDYVVEAQTDWGAAPAREIALAGGDERSVELKVEPAGAIRARVLPEGWTLGWLDVDLVDRSNDLPHMLRHQRVGFDGTLLLLGIRPGKYELRLRQRALDRAAAILLSVAPGRTTEVTLTLAQDQG